MCIISCVAILHGEKVGNREIPVIQSATGTYISLIINPHVEVEKNTKKHDAHIRHLTVLNAAVNVLFCDIAVILGKAKILQMTPEN